LNADVAWLVSLRDKVNAFFGRAGGLEVLRSTKDAGPCASRKDVHSRDTLWNLTTGNLRYVRGYPFVGLIIEILPAVSCGELQGVLPTSFDAGVIVSEPELLSHTFFILPDITCREMSSVSSGVEGAGSVRVGGCR